MQSGHPESIVLVTPTWKDSKRLSLFGPTLAEALRDSGLEIRWIVADDGSPAEEKSALADLVSDLQTIYPQTSVHFLEERSRKGGAIYSAWDSMPESDWFGYVDADGAIGADSVLQLIREACELGPGHACVGIRRKTGETAVHRALFRAVAWKTFTGFVRRASGTDFADTQCGAKVVPGNGYRAVREKLRETGFVFDVELLLSLRKHGVDIREIPIPWREIPGSTVHPFRDAGPMIAALLRIRKRLRAGFY